MSKYFVVKFLMRPEDMSLCIETLRGKATYIGTDPYVESRVTKNISPKEPLFTRHRAEKTVDEQVFELMKTRDSWSATEICSFLVTKGYARTTGTGALSRLKTGGYVSQIGVGQYTLSPKGRVMERWR